MKPHYRLHTDGSRTVSFCDRDYFDRLVSERSSHLLLLRPMSPEQINAAMRAKGITAVALARSMHLTQATVHAVIHGYSRSLRIRARIAEIIGRPKA